MRRHKMSNYKSRKMFTRHASHPHRMNMVSTSGAMRGGIRL